MENNSKKIASIIVSAIVVLGVLFVTIFMGNKSSDTTIAETTPPSAPLLNNQGGEGADNSVPPTTTPAPVTTPTDKPPKSASAYKDGTYSATGSYISPGGLDHVGVNLTLKNDIITAITVTPEPGDNTSARYQRIFVANYQPLVLGKNIADVSLSKVSGSSLTSRGFNEALTQIKAQAQEA